jgi:hypothetical protein
MIDEFVKTIKSNLYDRVTSPLAGAFFISWCLWNYAVLIILFSSYEAEKKIELIQGKLTLYDNSVLFPLITTGLFIFVYPYPARWVYSFWRKHKKELREARQEIENEELLSVEESRAYKRQIYKLREEHDREIERKDSEIETLKSEIENLKNEINQSRDRSEQDKTRKVIFDKIESDNLTQKVKAKRHNEIDEEQLHILQFMAELPDSNVNEQLIYEDMENIPKIRIKHKLDKLVALKLLSKPTSHVYCLNENSRAFLVDKGHY